MKKLLLVYLFIIGCGPVTPSPRLVASASLTDYAYDYNTYNYYNDCGPIYYYADGTYNATCTYPPDGVMTTEMVRIGNNLLCPGLSYQNTEYVNNNYDMMDYTVNCE